MKILITGANGLLGRVTTAHLAKDHDVLALVRELPGDPIPNIQYLTHDLRDPMLPLYSKINHLDAVVHTAQSRFYKDFPEEATDIFSINVQTTLNLLELGRHFKIKHFLFTSTGSVYEPYNNRLTETLDNNPTGFYAITKFLSEKLLASYQPFFKICIFRLFFLYGGLNSHSLINLLIRKVMEEAAITLEGTKGLQFTPTHIKDVAKLINLSLNFNWQGIINVASPETVSIKTLVEKIAYKMGKEPHWHPSDKQPACIIPSLDVLRGLYPMMDFITLEDGLNELLKDALVEIHA